MTAKKVECVSSVQIRIFGLFHLIFFFGGGGGMKTDEFDGQVDSGMDTRWTTFLSVF